jgi:hypothetical protein
MFCIVIKLSLASQPRTLVTWGLSRVCFIQNLGLQLAQEKPFNPPGQPRTRVTL